MSGPLHGYKIVELAGVGPGPMCATLLADLGATVLRIDRVAPSGLGRTRPVELNFMLRSRKGIKLDLKSAGSIELVLNLVRQADGLIEGFRPGVTERLGLGPTDCMAVNPKLVYGRVTGWGQDGPLSKSAGHDMNFIALSGALHAMGRAGAPPTPPLNIVGDYAGGGLYLAVGMLAALLECQKSGKGQVVDAAVVDGVANLCLNFYSMIACGLMNHERGTNLNDSGAPNCDVYETRDGKWMSVSPIEQKFFEQMLAKLGLESSAVPAPADRSRWPELRAILARKFKEGTRDEWTALFENTDCCVAPVLNFEEAMDHPHMAHRKNFVNVGGHWQPAVAPKFSRTIPDDPVAPKAPASEATDEALQGWLSREQFERYRADGVI